MATSSITKNFVVSDKKQVEQFADAIEMSYKESLSESSPSSCRYREIHETDEVYRVMEKWKKLYGGWFFSIKYQRIWEISSDMSGSFGCLWYRNSCRVLCESGFYGSFGENVKIVFAFWEKSVYNGYEWFEGWIAFILENLMY